MLAPLSWLKDYVDITLTPKELGEKLIDVGLGTEKITILDGDTIFEFEITPNRPDLLSIIGIAREIAAIEGKMMKSLGAKLNHLGGELGLHLGNSNGNLNPKRIFPLIIKTDPKINPRFTGIIIDGVRVKESPRWLKYRLLKIGQRPINNIVDIANYVMFELGNPIHAFDYDKINGHLMQVEQTKGGELFKSVDEISYHLPKGAVVIRDKENIIDLCGIKGGYNSGTFESTKTIFLRVPVEVPKLIRRASQALGFRSEASSIFERGVNAGGTIDALKRCVDLILKLAGGEIASNLYDIKEQDFRPWKLKLRIERLNKILGIEITEKRAISILQSLNLNPHVILGSQALPDDFRISSSSILRKIGDSGQARLAGASAKRARMTRTIECIIPTYRNDLKIEEDLIEEVTRLYGYNNFPKTIPIGEIPTKQIPYLKDYRIDEKIKNILKASGFSEVYTYSLVSEKDLVDTGLKPEKILRVDNPVSREFEYLRPTLKINLIKAFYQNKPNFIEINLFELGKVYLGKNLDEAQEAYFLSGITNTKNFFEVKGALEILFEELGIEEDSTRFIEILDEGIFFEINYSNILKNIRMKKKFVSIPKYPPIIEDIAVVASADIKTGDLINEIKKQSALIQSVSLLDQFEEARTFHIVYQHRERNLTTDEVSKIREKILKSLKRQFGAKLKE